MASPLLPVQWRRVQRLRALDTSRATPNDYERAHALDVPQLFAFLRATQPETFKKLAIPETDDSKDINRLKFLTRLSAEIGKRGVIDVPLSAVFNASSKTASPVLLAKSPTTMVSFSPRGGVVWRERK